MKKIAYYFTTVIKYLFLSFILLSMANLFFEVLLITKGHLNTPENQYLENLHFPKQANQNFLDKHVNDLVKGAKIAHYLPSVGQAYDFSQATSFKGTSEGRRVTSSESLKNKKYQGLMLGASQSWGYFVPDNQIVSQILIDKLTNVGIDNYSILGITVQQSIFYWQSIKDDLPQQDFLLHIAGVMDILQYCEIEPMSFYSKKEQSFQMGLVRFYKKIKKIVSSDASVLPLNTYPCSTPKEAENVVLRVINDLEFMIYLAKKNNIKFAIIIPPVPFIDGPNIKNLENDPNFIKRKKILSLAYEILDKKIALFKDSHVVNLMHAFDGSEPHFIDSTGHFSESGHRKLAEKIITHLGEDFFKSESNSQK